MSSAPVVWLDTDDDNDPYYSWQEEMSHRAKANRISYGAWIKQKLDQLDQIGRAYADYSSALKRREHAGVAASRLAEIVADVFASPACGVGYLKKEQQQ
jgi:hypothetical protein